MAQINVNHLTFYYEGSSDNIFEDVSFSIDTCWKLGFIGRNGKGKTTFLNLLLGKYEYQGTIQAPAVFDYFPYQLNRRYLQACAAEFYDQLKPGSELWQVACELDKLEVDAEALYRPFATLSQGERTKVLLALLFSGDNDFLLIDEPTNHLDLEARESVKKYLAKKKGFLLVSHDRDLLDACIDHVLVLNRCSIEVQAGNFSSWQENKARADAFSLAENEKHRKEINKLAQAAKRAAQWADKSERSKIGFDPIKDPGHGGKRAYIGAKTKKMESRVKQMEKRIGKEIKEKEGLLQDIELSVDLKVSPLAHPKNVLVTAKDYGLKYAGAKGSVMQHVDFELCQGDRMFVCGKNGCGKSSLIQSILRHIRRQQTDLGQTSYPQSAMACTAHPELENSIIIQADQVLETGLIKAASSLQVSYVDQDTSYLAGTVSEFCAGRNLEESLFCAVLSQLGIERVQFSKKLEEFSEGQKKKALLAASLLTPAHLYIWDEPLNYIDLFSRIQLERLIKKYQPTMLVVEHDARFQEEIATKRLFLDARQGKDGISCSN